jgi:transposase
METRFEKRDFNPGEYVVAAFDVSKAKLNWYTEEPSATGRIVEMEGLMANRTGAIRERVKGLLEMSARHGRRLLVVCESTGGYERSLLRTARSLGSQTCYVSGEATHKLTVVESNDTGKNDPKDARVIYRVAMLRTALLTHRQDDPGYERLRELNAIYEDEDGLLVQVRNQICGILQKLFCDFSFGNDVALGKTGRAFFVLYGLNPYRAAAAGQQAFLRSMKFALPRVRAETLRRLWEDVESSVRLLQAPALVAILEARIAELMAAFDRHSAGKEAIREQMVSIYQRLPEYGRLTATGVGDFALARVVAETGAFDGYRSWHALLRLAGLNLKAKSSGKKVGRPSISKKGRPLLRKVLYQIAFSVLTQGSGPFAGYYRERRKEPNPTPAKKLYVNVMRRFLKALLGAYRQGRFIKDRLFLDEVNYARKKAA